MSLMMKDKTGEIVKVAGNSGGGASDADKVKYDNVTSGIEATNVQSAVDELAEKKADKTEILPTFTLVEYEEIKDTIPVGTKFIITDDVDGLDNYIPVPQTAEVGQILAVKTVDSEGKPIEWETVDKGGGSSEDGRIVKTYNLVEGTQIPIQTGVYYPCHLYWVSNVYNMTFGEYAYLSGTDRIRVEFLHPSGIGNTTKIVTETMDIVGTYFDSKGVFVLDSSYSDYKLMI